MTEKVYTAERLFFDTRELLSYCENALEQHPTQNSPKDYRFYSSLRDRLKDFVDKEHYYISIAGQEDKTVLHCINMHRYEVEGLNVALEFTHNSGLIHAPSINPIGAEYNYGVLLEQTQDYIDRKEHIRQKSKGSPIEGIMQRDIELKTAFAQTVRTLDKHHSDNIIIPYDRKSTYDSAVVKHINTLTS